VVRDVWIQKNRSLEEDRALIQSHIKDLKDRQENILDRLISSKSELVQTRLEEELEQLEQTIKATKKKLLSRQLREDQIEAFFEIAKQRMEHPGEAIFSSATKPQLEKNWSFIFAQCPTYQDLLDGTPQLTLLYRLNRDIGADQNQLAGQLSHGWNTFEQQVISLLDWETPANE
jgi:septal ring factor EnvC (AmiA/AmiB activator)